MRHEILANSLSQNTARGPAVHGPAHRKIAKFTPHFCDFADSRLADQ